MTFQTPSHMDASTSHRFCVRMRGSQKPYLFAEAATLEKRRSYCLGYGWPSRGIKVNFGASDAIEIGGRAQFM
jgi:hypothetical protein